MALLYYLSANQTDISDLCTWHLEAYLVGYTLVGQTCINLLKKLINSILTLWCLNKDTNNISLFVTERSFVTELVLISRRLQTVASKSVRLHRLHAELLTLDRSLSQPIFIPLVSLPDHVVVRIPYKESSVLNSKDKAPYLMYVEVIECSDGQSNFIDVNAFRQINPSEMSSANNPSDSNEQSSIWSRISVLDIRKKIESNSQQTLIRSSSTCVNSQDPSEPWKEKVERIKNSSPFGGFPGWNLYSIIVKYGDDLRQDYLAYQFLKVCKNIWEIENIQVWVQP
ncbi:hypothetical protein MXB_4124 [Myxobolus squamalis]|nr:hypothetical protein MXB_4124 [Myxobolus squamalis]